ncbi:MAG: PKD domain-containing protein [Candidatus Syntrophoarchaeum caldarius]|uniref:PKD domain-containing protein n=1 Tax=Candidatus Syntropharchaeum caldarium TaxID=1838285 RepID=A0A1F2P789_9EURY|nr:MAG: PKD domain-containing protein [Candidatus Syntrophoarchaeum caldarius]
MKKLHGEDAVSSLVGALLLLAIFVSFIAMLQVHSVPVWNREVEYGHMDTLYNDFSNFKVAVEDSVIYNLPKSASIHMGTRYPTRVLLRNPQSHSSGTLTIVNNSWVNISYGGKKIAIQTATLSFEPNHLYADTPTLVYEYGTVIRSYSNANVTTDDQSIIREGRITIPVILTGENLTSISGSEVREVNLNPATEALPIIINPPGDVNITLTTSYPDVWKRLLDDIPNTNVSGNTIFINRTGIKEIRYPENATASGLYAGLIRISNESTAKSVRLYPKAILDNTSTGYWLDLGEVTMFRYDDGKTYRNKQTWRNTPPFPNPNVYFSFYFDSPIPQNARIINATLVNKYAKSDGNITCEVKIYNSTSESDYIPLTYPLTYPSLTCGEYIRTTDDLNNLSVKLFGYNTYTLASPDYTYHDLTYIEITYI